MGIPLRGPVPSDAPHRFKFLVSPCPLHHTISHLLSDQFFSRTNQYRISLLFGNSLYLLAFGYYIVITFLGYNALPFLHHTELLLAPIAILTILWFASLFGLNLPKHLAPVLWAGAKLRKDV